MSGRALLLDLDGTLIDSRSDIARAVNHALTGVGLPARPLGEVAACVGDGAATLIERLSPGANQATRQRALELFKDSYAERCWVDSTIYAGIGEALAAFRRDGWLLAVVTNKPLEHTTRILARSGLAAQIDAVRGGDATRKPDPGQLRESLAELQASAATSWMIGDHHTDIRAGHAAGCQVCFCAWGFGRDDGLEVEARAESPARLVDVIARRT
ncbi:MAG: HAD-IIIA family hydrolase [Planctomycetes bacterium]|nr:HAD-IIIA family hydrolase [Planctomycetota bacterium]